MINPETRNERVNRFERWFLAAILLEPERLSEVRCTPEHFLTTAHRDIFAAMVSLADAGEIVDVIGIADELDKTTQGGYVYLAALYDELGVCPENIQKYDREIRAACRERQFHGYTERLADAETSTDQLNLLASMTELLRAEL